MTIFITNPDLPEPVQAASLALALIKRAKVQTWAEVTADHQGEDIDSLSPDQVRLLTTYRDVLVFLRKGPPLRTIAVCDTCGFVTITSGPVSSRCVRPRGCSGKMVRASAATRMETPAHS